MAFLDIHAISDGHLLVIQKKHIRDIHTLDTETGAEIMKVAKEMSDLLMKSFNHDGIMLMEVNGVFQDVPHFHLHVFGRNKNNDIQFKYPLNSNSDVETLKHNADKLFAKMA